ncbi:MAG: DASS family sodium-coupled anion symporter [Fimbriimonadaceae bacterium]
MKTLRLLSPIIAFAMAYFALGQFEGRLVGAVFAATVVLWITELMPHAMTALLSTTSLVVIAGIEEKKAFGAYGDPIIPLFIGSFILAKAMETSGLSDRFAWIILSRKWATKSPSSLILALGVLTCTISLFVSNTATTAMFLPIGLSMLSALKKEQGTFPIGVMLMLTWGSSVAVGVPVGTPPNLIALADIEKTTGVSISFGQWMAFGMPITILMVIACWLILKFLYGKDAPPTVNAHAVASDRLKEMGQLKASERNALFAFSVAFLLWVLPDIVAVILGQKAETAVWLKDHVPASVAALVASAMLFILPCKEVEQRMTWKTATQIDWGTILLFGGGIALGQAMFSSGLAKDLGELAARASGAHSLWAITALVTAAAIILSELASNTAAATTLVPMAIGLAQGAGVSPIAPALGVALGASLGFMLPVSTAPNAIVYSSGLVPSKQMMKAGIMLDVVGFFITLGGLWLILPRLGL